MREMLTATLSALAANDAGILAGSGTPATVKNGASRAGDGGYMDSKQAAVLRALLSKGATLRPVMVGYPNQPFVKGYQLTLTTTITIDGVHAREVAELDGVREVPE